MTSKEKTGFNLKTHYEKEGKTAERPLAKNWSEIHGKEMASIISNNFLFTCFTQFLI